MFSNWSPRLPEIKRILGFNNLQIGLSFMGVAVGAGTAFFLGGLLRRKFGSITILRFTSIVICVVYALLSWGRHPWQFALVFFGLGLLFQPLDVNANVLGAFYEKMTGKYILARMHGFFSLGAFIGSATSSLCAFNHVPYRKQFVIVAVLAICIAAYATIMLKPVEASTEQAQPQHKEKLGVSWQLGVLAVLGFCALFIEGTTIDWSSLFLSEGKHIPTVFTTLGLPLFQFAIMCGRFSGDFVRARLSIERIFIVATSLTVIALLCIMLLPPYASLASYLLLGFGLCIFFPLLVGSSSMLFPHAPHAAVAVISAVALGAMLCGPASIGPITHTFGMLHGMWVQPVLSWVILLMLPAFILALKRAKIYTAPSLNEIADLIEETEERIF